MFCSLSELSCSQNHSGIKMSEGENCKCPNPLTASPGLMRGWDVAFEITKELAANATKTKPKLVLLGDSITRNWTGMRGGRLKPKFTEHSAVFKEILTKEGGGKFDSVPLGIGGDRVSESIYESWSSPTAIMLL
jgi:hypothetical protein